MRTSLGCGCQVALCNLSVAAGDPEDALTEELDRVVIDLPSLPLVAKTGSKRFGQAETLVGGLEQDGAAVGVRLLLIEGGDEGLFEQIGKQDRLFVVEFVKRKPPVLRKVLWQALSITRGLLCVQDS